MDREELPDWLFAHFTDTLQVTEIHRCLECESFIRSDFVLDDDFTEETVNSFLIYPGGRLSTSVSSKLLFADEDDGGELETPVCPVCDIEMAMFFYDEIYEGEDDGYEGED